MIKYIKKYSILSIFKFNLLLLQDVRQLVKCQFLCIDIHWFLYIAIDTCEKNFI